MGSGNGLMDLLGTKNTQTGKIIHQITVQLRELSELTITNG